jgi:hypothetical protein
MASEVEITSNQLNCFAAAVYAGGRSDMMRPDIDFRLDHAAERCATILVAFCRLATAFHSTHARRGLWLMCDDPTCRANASNLRRWRSEELEPAWLAGGQITH